MIQIYSPSNTDYTKNGDMPLLPSAASVHAILNGTWEAELTHPIDSEGRWEYIVEEAVVKLPSFNGEQLFRIKTKEKSDSGVTATMEPIFLDAMNDCFLVDVRPTGKNGQQALDLMTAPNSKYSGQSNITKTATAYYQFKNLIEAINGEEDNSFINRWGGEILFDNHTVIINTKVGGDYGVELRYGKNIPQDGMSEEIDIRDVVTRIYPKAYNGYTMTNNGYVDSPLRNSYPTIKCATITFEDVKMAEDAQEDDEENGVIICDTQAELNAALTQKCNEQYAAGLDKPKVTISADMVLLQNTEQYQDYAVLETVSLGDTIHCINHHLGIVTDARVIELEYDSLRQAVTAVVIGDFQYNYFQDVTSSVGRIDNAIRPDGSVKADQISGIINGMVTRLQAMKGIAETQDVRAILFEDLNPDSPTYGAMALGTAGFEISAQRTADGKDWEWSTFGTAEGFYATYLIAGVLSSRNWQQGQMGFRLNLDEGTIDSKNMKMGIDGVLRLYQAVIEGGSFTVYYENETGQQTIMFIVNENGVGIGPGGETLLYNAGEDYIAIDGEARIVNGALTSYESGYKAVEISSYQIKLYAWNDGGNYVGSVGATKSGDQVGVSVWCDQGDYLTLGYQNENGDVIPVMRIDSNDPDNPLYIANAYTGNFPVVNNVLSSGAQQKYRIYVKNGLITGVENE